MEKSELVVYSDYVCPFCYLGKAALEEYLASAEDPPEVTWRPFDLRGQKRSDDGTIDESVQDGKDEAYFAQVRQNVERLKEKYGVEMSFGVSMDVDSWNAQKAALYVGQQHDEATFRAFHEALFTALWVKEMDIGDPDVLADVAAEVGVVEPDEVREAATDEQLDKALEKEFASAHAAGVTAVPTFTYEHHVVRGAVPPAQLRRLVEGV